MRNVSVSMSPDGSMIYPTLKQHMVSLYSSSTQATTGSRYPPSSSLKAGIEFMIGAIVIAAIKRASADLTAYSRRVKILYYLK